MSKNVKRIVVSALVVVMAASAALGAFAMDAPVPVVPISGTVAPSDNSMETALIAVKGLIGVDDDVFTDFSYSSSYSSYGTSEGVIWSFTWTDLKNAHIYASATADGLLLNFWKYSGEEKSFGFAEISKEAAIAKAAAFIKEANPDTYSYYKSPQDVNLNINSKDYRVIYYAEVNGYSFNPSYISVQVNKFNGEVTGYDTSNINPVKFSFEDASSVIGEDAAISAYAEKIGLNLEYASFYNYENNKLTVFPVYRFGSRGDKYISAVTGDVVNYVFDRGSSVETAASYGAAAPSPSAMNEAADSGGGGSRESLTPDEISAIEKVSSFISSEQALQKLLDTMGLTGLDLSEFRDQYISLNRDYFNRDRYCYDIYMYKTNMYPGKEYGVDAVGDDEIVNISGRVDAASGRVISFSFGYDYGIQYAEREPVYTVEQAKASVEEFLKKEAAAEFAGSKYEETESIEAVPYSYRSGNYHMQYIRHENGVPFRNNGISVVFNAHTGRITNYSLSWYENVTFPGIGGVLQARQALAAFVAQNGSSINYITVGGGDAALVYEFNKSEFVDPYTGKALGYNGELWKDETVAPAYDDIKGHWNEEVIQKLLDNGVVKWSGSFEPEKTMTQLEFLEYLMLVEPYSYYRDALAFFMDRKIDIEADANTIVTRQEAVRIVVEYLGYGKLAQQHIWFVYPFSDSISDGYKGYVTICYMLGVISGESGRAFNPESSITRAQAALMLHNLIIAKG